MELVGRTLGEFTVGAKIGEGGFAVVHRAEQASLERDAVVKVLHPHLAARPEVAERFLREARLASRIDHPFAAHVYAFGAEPDGTLWIAMELVRGAPMDQLLATRGPLPPAMLAPLFERICDVVQAAHDRGIVHRDLKPGNVIVVERGGRLFPKLLDFGLARALDDDHPPPAVAATAAGSLAVTADWNEPAAATRRGRVMGSPAYMAPEQWIDATSVGPATDIYALGVLAYQALSGRVPFAGPALDDVRRGHLEEPPPPLAGALDAVLARALAKAPRDRYASPTELAAALRAAVAGGDGAGAADEDAADEDPYRGLAPFTEGDADRFVGREQEVDRFVERMLAEPLLAVIGPSGAGKSSFARAGVIARLPPGWRAIVVRPGAAPLAALEAHLRAAGVDVGDLRDDPGRLRSALAAAAGRERTTLVLVIDQLEELFTLGKDDGELAGFARALAAAARHDVDPVRVVVTLRDDFLVRAGGLPSLGPRLIRGLHLLTTPSAADLERIIVEPARRAGYRLEDPRLAGEIVGEVADQAGALAMLSFTAAALWRLRDRDRRRLTRAAYAAIGGVGGALARHAEETLAALTAEDQRLVRVAFRHLVTDEGTRQVLGLAELCQLLAPPGERARAEAVIDRLIDARLLVAAEDAGGTTRVEVIHEALLSAWPRLVDWRREDAEGARLRAQLRAAARQWDERARSPGLLWRDEALAELRRWRARHPELLTDVEQAFARASIAAESRGRRIRRALVAAAFVAVGAAALVLFELRGQATRQRHLAEQRAGEIADRLIDSELRRGQQALLAGDHATAREALGKVIAAGAASPAARFMLARASDPLAAEVATLAAGDGRVWNAAFRPDGTRVVTVGDQHVTLWDGRGHRKAELAGHPPGPRLAAWSPDGSQLATVDARGTLRLWTADGALEVETPGPGNGGQPAAVLVYRHDGARIVTAIGGEIMVWDARSGARLASWVQDGGVATVIFDPTGERLLATGYRGRVVLSALDGSRPLELRGHTAGVWYGAFGAGRIVTGSIDGTARIWDATTGAPLHLLLGHEARVTHLAIDPRAQYVATASLDGTARVWRLDSGELVSTLRGHTAQVNSVLWTPAGQLVTTSADGTCRVWEAVRGLQTAVFAHGGFVLRASVDGAGRWIATASWNGTAKLWDLGRQARLGAIGPDADGARRSAPRPLVAGGRMIRYGLHGVAAWDLTGRDPPWTRELAVTAAALSSEGGLLVVGGADGGLRVLDAAGGAELLAIAGGGKPIGALAIDRGRGRIVAADQAGTVSVHDLAGGRRVAAHPFGDVGALALSTRGALLVYTDAYLDEAMHDAWLTDLELSAPRRLLDASADIAFSPSGRWLATATWTGDARIWDLDGGEGARALATRNVSALAWSPDERTLVTGGDEGSLALWDPATGERRATLEGHASDIRAIAFDPTGELFATTGADQVVKVWALTPRLLVARIGVGHDVASAVAFVGDRLVTAGLGFADLWAAGS